MYSLKTYTYCIRKNIIQSRKVVLFLLDTPETLNINMTPIFSIYLNKVSDLWRRRLPISNQSREVTPLRGGSPSFGGSSTRIPPLLVKLNANKVPTRCLKYGFVFVIHGLFVLIICIHCGQICRYNLLYVALTNRLLTMCAYIQQLLLVTMITSEPLNRSSKNTRHVVNPWNDISLLHG